MRTSGSSKRGLEGTLNKKQRTLLSRRICDLSLKIEGSHLEGLISQLYSELEKAGINFRPKFYLSDGWGCPDGCPVIGIPFYLADKQLAWLEGQLTGIEAETETEIMKFLRHETGHAFNYAYLFYKKQRWRKLFGSFSRPYREDYRPVPFSSAFVRNTPGWYGQKHPDEDFAETFAVLLTPGLDWKEIYNGTPALAKLLYVKSLIEQYGGKPPLVTRQIMDVPVKKMNISLETWYRLSRESYRDRITLPDILDADLRILLPSAEGISAEELLRYRKGQLLKVVNCWTGMNRHVLDALIEKLISRFGNLGLKIEERQLEESITTIAVFITTLAMNYTCRGKFVQD